MLFESGNIIKVGSRDSELAMFQTRYIIEQLELANPGTTYKIISKSTQGDKILDVALSKIGLKGLFTKELDAALITGEVDFVVNSMKDIQPTLPPGLAIGCVCSRESLEDAVLMAPHYRGYKLSELPDGSVIGTSAVRRIAQLKRSHPNLVIAPVRGNLNTRLLKLDDPVKATQSGKGDGRTYAALILAKAGVDRMGWEDRIDEVLDSDSNLYAAGQGALAVECRIDDLNTLTLLSSIHDEVSALTCITERSLLLNLEGGCSTPIGVRSWTRGDWRLGLTAAVYSIDGSICIENSLQCQLPLTEQEVAALDQEEEVKMEAIRLDQSHETIRTCDKPKRLRANSESEGTYLADRLPPKRKRTASQSEADMASDIALSEIETCSRTTKPNQRLYAGVLIYPICEIGRKRMWSACSLGYKLAENLRGQGAGKLLNEIKMQEAEARQSQLEINQKCFGPCNSETGIISGHQSNQL